MACMQSFDRLCRRIVQPTRHQISENQMISRKFKKNKVDYKQLNVITKDGYKLSGVAFHKNWQTYPTILYLHGNGGYKLQCLQLMYKDNFNYNIVAFDFRACGKSQGQYLTYGHNQVEDIGLMIKTIRKSYGIKDKVIIWGRSMGASLALMYAASNSKDIYCLILDSPFPSMEKISMNIANSTASIVPNFLLRVFFYFVKRRVNTITGQDVFGIDFKQFLKQAKNIPIMFAYSDQDNVVKKQDVYELYDDYQGQKTIIGMNGMYCDNIVLHHQDRPEHFLKEAFKWIGQAVGKEQNSSSRLNTKTSAFEENRIKSKQYLGKSYKNL